ncbi:hypothetical protein BO219_11520, partial [Anoxybacillus kestanbolensis]
SLFSSVHQGKQISKWNKMVVKQLSYNHFVNSLKGCPWRTSFYSCNNRSILYNIFAASARVALSFGSKTL